MEQQTPKKTKTADTDLAWKVFLWAMAITLGWIYAQQRELTQQERKNDTRLTVIESSRCSSADCSSIRASLSSLESRVAAFPTEIPPKWFENKVNTLERRIEIMEQRQWARQSGGNQTDQKSKLNQHR